MLSLRALSLDALPLSNRWKTDAHGRGLGRGGRSRQGYSETSHGLSDTLLSVLAVRSREIARSLLELGTAMSEARI